MVKITLNVWDRLIGPLGEYSSENRTVNAVGVITLMMLALMLPINFFVNLAGSAVVGTILIAAQSILYYISRFKRQYKLSIIIYASFCYLGLIINYWYNSGVSGPTLFIFFLTFQLLIAITPKPQHKIWAPLHLIFGLVLLLTEYLFPSLVQKTYDTREGLFFDIASSYVISLSFIYIITNYLLNRYEKEKKLAKERADAIEEQNKALKEIAWMQSHKVRSHVATILGLAEVIDTCADKTNNDRILVDIKQVAKDLDNVIRDINQITNDASARSN